jgi:Protein of unknown function (DUF1631)
MSGAKVVGIHGGNAGAEGSNVKPLPMPLVKLRELLKQKVHTLLRNLFDGADDALFAMADKAGTNNEQTLYFDAMRELRLQKKHIATHVVKGLISSFNEVGHYRSATSMPSGDSSAVEDLSLIQHDDLEIKVALEGMVNRLRSASAQSLGELHTRVSSQISPLTIDNEQLPAGPEILCDAFIEGCEVLDIEIRAQLVVLKLYEKFVLSEMQQVYADANNLFIQLGIMPDLRHVKRAPQQASTSTPTQEYPTTPGQSYIPAAGQSAQGRGDGSIPQLDDLIQLLHQGDRVPSQTLSDVPTLSDVYYSQGELVGALSGFQSEHIEQLGNASVNRVIDFRSLLNNRLAEGDCKADYAEMDADVINLVSMFFEFILDDKQLQPTMKALIARLQIPILKVALLDRSFFNKGGHPARKLLNEMARVGIGWNEPAEGKKDRLKDKIEEIVQRVLSEFDQDVSMFAELLQDFSNFVDVEQRRGQLVEQRTKDSEKGKVASELAKVAAQDSLNESMRGQIVPDFMMELLRDGWSSVMVLHFLKEGSDGEGWLQASTLVDELLWSINPHSEERDARTKLLKMIPSLMKRLRTGLKEVSFDDSRAKPLLKALEDAHVKSLQRLQSEQLSSIEEVSPSVAEVMQVEEVQPEVVALAASEESLLDDDAVADLLRSTAELEQEFDAKRASAEVPELEPAAESQTLPEATEHKEEQDHEEIVLISAEPEPEQAAIDESDPFVQQVEKFAVGCWFEFQNDSKTERCKLAAVIKATGKYIFVNRSGIKVAEKTKMGLAVEMRRGSVQILNDGLLFDRALESIITNLRGKNA